MPHEVTRPLDDAHPGGRTDRRCRESVDAVTGIGLPAPCTKSVGTSTPPSRPARAGSSAVTEAKVSRLASIDCATSGIAGAFEGPSKYAGHNSRNDSSASATVPLPGVQPTLQFLHALGLLGWRPAKQLRDEQLAPTVADSA